GAPRDRRRPRRLRRRAPPVHLDACRGRRWRLRVPDPRWPARRAAGAGLARRQPPPDAARARGVPNLHRDGAGVHEHVTARRLALFGGVYSNAPALAAALADARRRGAEALFCLGDLGGFGPHPDRVFPLLDAAGVKCVQGNYDRAIAAGAADCGCGYTDPRDNHFAALSYRYTLRRTATEHRRWLAALPPVRHLIVGDVRLLLCHGSPRQLN